MSFDPRAGGQPESYGPSFRDPFSPPAQPRRSNSWLWLLGCGSVMLLLCCGGGVGIVGVGFTVMSSEVKNQMRDNPKFREHIGEVQEFEMDLAGSFADDVDESFRYRVRGTKGSGELTVMQSNGPNGTQTISQAELRLADGTKVQVMP